MKKVLGSLGYYTVLTGLFGASFLACIGGCKVFQSSLDDIVVNPPVGIIQNQTAVVVGLDFVDPGAYGGWDGKLDKAVSDAVSEVAFLRARGIRDIKLLTNEKATKFSVLRACLEQGAKLSGGGTLHLYISGHGGQVFDISGDEVDGLDETLCLYDGQFNDDLVRAALSKLPKDRNVRLVTDTCNSGTNYKGQHDYVRALQVRAAHRDLDIVCGLLHWGGCGDGESSYEDANGGVFTSVRHSTYIEGITWGEWDTAVLAGMPRNQRPIMNQMNRDCTCQLAYCPPGLGCDGTCVPE